LAISSIIRSKRSTERSAAKSAYDELYREVVECRLAPGERLTESSVAERLGLGKTPVREALRQLMLQGLVLVTPRHGYFVAPITIRDVDELFQLRRIIESAAAGLAADNHANASAARLNELFAATCRASDRAVLGKFLGANAAFHIEVASLTGSRRIVEMTKQLLSESDRLIYFGMAHYFRDCQQPHKARETASQHQVLTEAILAGDRTKACRIAEAHIDDTRTMIVEALLADTRFRELAIS
jgi:DNA-binding GntR family transcriptional regulator